MSKLNETKQTTKNGVAMTEQKSTTAGQLFPAAYSCMTVISKEENEGSRNSSIAVGLDAAFKLYRISGHGYDDNSFLSAIECN